MFPLSRPGGSWFFGPSTSGGGPGSTGQLVLAGYTLQLELTARPMLFKLGVAGANPTVTLSKNGANFVPAVGTVSELSQGWYVLPGGPDDLDTLGPLLLRAVDGTNLAEAIFTVVNYDPNEAS